MTNKLSERLQADEENSVDRRKVSAESKRRIAEAVRRNNTDAALRNLFEIVTGDVVADHPTVRDIDGQITLGTDVTIEDNQSLILSVSLGEQTDKAYLNNTGGAYRFAELPPGEYQLSVTVQTLREYDMETLESTDYDADATLTYDTTVMIDAEQVAVGESVSGPEIVVDSLSVSNGGTN